MKKMRVLGVLFFCIFFASQGASAGQKALFLSDDNLHEIDLDTMEFSLVYDAQQIIRMAKYNPFDLSEIAAIVGDDWRNTSIHILKDGFFLSNVGNRLFPYFDYANADEVLIPWDRDPGDFEHTYMSLLNLRTGVIKQIDEDSKNDGWIDVTHIDGVTKYIYTSDMNGVACGYCTDMFFGEIVNDELILEGTIANAYPISDREGAWSPSAERIAYTRLTSSYWHIYVYDIESGTDILVTSGRFPLWINENEILYKMPNGNLAIIDLETRSISDLGVLGTPVDLAPTEPDINVDPIEYDFGSVKLLDWDETPRMTTVTISNDGGADLTINDIDLVEGVYVNGDPELDVDVEFGIVDPLPLFPTIIPPGETLEILVKYIPKKIYNIYTLFHIAEAELIIKSDDPDEPEVWVAFSGKGTKEDNIDPSARAFEETAGDLFGASLITLGDDGNSGANKFNSLIDEVLTAGGHITEGNITEACDSLWSAYKFTDGQDKPKDKIYGVGASTLASMIIDMMTEQGCTQTP